MWSWHLAQPTVMPMNAVETVSTAAMGISLVPVVARDGRRAPGSRARTCLPAAFERAHAGRWQRDVSGR